MPVSVAFKLQIAFPAAGPALITLERNGDTDHPIDDAALHAVQI